MEHLERDLGRVPVQLGRIQALVILFTGAMGDMLRIPLQRLFALRGAP